jgi:hypothetical protein
MNNNNAKLIKPVIKPVIKTVIKPLKMTITDKNNRIYKEEWENIGFNSTGPVDCEHEHPITGKCMSHYDYQVWLNRHRNTNH